MTVLMDWMMSHIVRFRCRAVEWRLAVLLPSYAGDSSARSHRDRLRQGVLQDMHFYPK